MDITDEKLAKFNALLAEWLKEGKLHFVLDIPAYREENKAELPVYAVLEFGAGGERIDNIDGNFTWKDLIQMADGQGLLK